MEVAEGKGQQTESEHMLDKLLFIVHIHHKFRQGTVCRSRYAVMTVEGLPYSKVAGCAEDDFSRNRIVTPTLRRVRGPEPSP